MKLSRRKAHWTIRHKQKVVGTKEIARDMKVSRRRVQQIWKSSHETGEEPIIGQNIGRPKKPYVKREAEMIATGLSTTRNLPRVGSCELTFSCSI
jgi:putative transposase